VTGREQDPWGDLTWSDGEPAPPVATPSSPDADADAVVVREGATPGAAMAGQADEAAPACPWCATPAAEGATRCTSCGAALAQRESIGDLVVPGLTAVDPALKDLDGRPLHLRGPSPTQGVASGLVVAAAAGGPIGLAIVGGVGALAAAEYLGAGGESGKGHEQVGETSGAVLQAVERLERGEALPTANDPTPRPELGTAAPAASAPAPDPTPAPASAPERSKEEDIDGSS
jgi:hypothetical protein